MNREEAIEALILSTMHELIDEWSDNPDRMGFLLRLGLNSVFIEDEIDRIMEGTRNKNA